MPIHQVSKWSYACYQACVVVVVVVVVNCMVVSNITITVEFYQNFVPLGIHVIIIFVHCTSVHIDLDQRIILFSL